MGSRALASQSAGRRPLKSGVGSSNRARPTRCGGGLPQTPARSWVPAVSEFTIRAADPAIPRGACMGAWVGQSLGQTERSPPIAVQNRDEKVSSTQPLMLEVIDPRSLTAPEPKACRTVQEAASRRNLVQEGTRRSVKQHVGPPSSAGVGQRVIERLLSLGPFTARRLSCSALAARDTSGRETAAITAECTTKRC